MLDKFYPTSKIFRFNLRRMCTKLKFMPRSQKWMMCLGVVISTLCLLFLRNRLSSSDYYSVAHHHHFGSGIDRRIFNPVTSKGVNISSSNNFEVVRISSETVRHQHHPHHFQYNLNEKQICYVRHDSEKNRVHSAPFLLIFVSSAPKHADRRSAIRQAWANRHLITKWGVVVVFLIGATNDQNGQDLLNGESSTFHDLVQGNFIDSYYNLSIKSMMGLNWTKDFCSDVKYVMKTDDDVYINVELLVEFLRIYGQRRWIGGCIKQVKAPSPFNQQGVQVSLNIGHPPFVAGAGYVISGDIVADLYEAALQKSVVPVEDAFITAYCAQTIGVKPSHYEGFNCGEPVFDDCQMKYKFVGHHVSPQRQQQIWNALYGNESICKMLRS